LLGFQFRGVFSEGYEQLPTDFRYLDGVALGLMVCVVALLILPGPYHRIVEGGEDTVHIYRLVTVIADLALLPFAVALGLDIAITGGRSCGEIVGAAIGIATTAVAFALWYGFPRWRMRHTHEQEPAMNSRKTEVQSSTPLHAKIEQMLTEARVILPGAQALFGFQLAIVLTQSFDQLPAGSRLIHTAGMLLVTLSVVLLMAPAAYHRIASAGEDTRDMQRVGSVLVTAATVPLALGLACEVYVVIAKIAESSIAGRIAALLCGCALIGLWHVYPLAAAFIRNRTE
jgi:Family of unknown function (DUF6328)